MKAIDEVLRLIQAKDLNKTRKILSQLNPTEFDQLLGSLTPTGKNILHKVFESGFEIAKEMIDSILVRKDRAIFYFLFTSLDKSGRSPFEFLIKECDYAMIMAVLQHLINSRVTAFKITISSILDNKNLTNDQKFSILTLMGEDAPSILSYAIEDGFDFFLNVLEIVPIDQRQLAVFQLLMQPDNSFMSDFPWEIESLTRFIELISPNAANCLMIPIGRNKTLLNVIYDNYKIHPLYSNLLAKCGFNSKDLVSYTIATDNKDQLIQLLQDQPFLAETSDSLGNNLLHQALFYNRPNIVSYLCQTMPNITKKLVTQVNICGETPIQIACQYSDGTLIEETLDILGDQAQVEVRRVTDSNQTTLELLRFNTNKNQKAQERIEAIIKNNSIPNLNLPIDFDELIKKYPEMETDPVIRENFYVGTLVANYVRTICLRSNTHPSVNGYSQEERASIVEFICDMREQINSSTGPINNMNNTVNHAKKYSIGNCHEISYLVADMLIKLGIKTNIEVCSLAGGDHVFVIVGRDPSTDIKCPSGKGGFVIDAWAGTLYPLSSIPEKLGYYRYQIDENICLTGPVNWNVHEIKLKAQINEATSLDDTQKDCIKYAKILRAHPNLTDLVVTLSKKGKAEEYLGIIQSHPKFFEKYYSVFFKYPDIFKKYDAVFHLDEINFSEITLQLVEKIKSILTHITSKHRFTKPDYFYAIKQILTELKQQEKESSGKQHPVRAIESMVVRLSKLDMILSNTPNDIQHTWQNFMNYINEVNITSTPSLIKS